VRCCLILHNLIIRIEEELGLRDTTDWARNDVGDHEEYEEEHEEYFNVGDGEDEEDAADFNDPAAAAGKAFREHLAQIAQNL
jgi:hypothetical protein